MPPALLSPSLPSLQPTPAGKWAVSAPFQGSGGHSIEDIQWSPSERDVFATASVDGRLRVWDTRTAAKPAVEVQAHDADINVISWSRLASCMLGEPSRLASMPLGDEGTCMREDGREDGSLLTPAPTLALPLPAPPPASGSDDTSLRIWDLRNFKPGQFVADFRSHKGPISSVEWSPHESSVLATCSADNTLAVWDLSLERDAEEERELARGAAAPSDAELPPQLLFLHLGMSQPKELHWHPHIPGLMAVTAGDGFNVFRPSNI